jgi:hypothetical protein
MMNQPLHITDDRLIDLTHHLLPEQEEKDALEHLEGCEVCEARFRELLNDYETAKSRFQTSKTDGKGVISLPRRRPRRLGAVAVVASAIIVAAIGHFALHRSSSGPYWIDTDAISSPQRGEDELASQALTDAFAAYARHDVKASVEQLRDAPVPNDEMLSSLRLLLLASAEVNAGQAKDGLDDLEKLSVDTLPPQWRSEARWVQYLALRESGDTEAARARLQTLVSEEGRIGQLAREEMVRVEKR